MITASLEVDRYHAIEQYLKLRGYQVTRLNAGGRRGGVRLGKAGWPDFVACSPHGAFIPVEVKREGQGLRDSQREFAAWCKRHDIPYYIVHNVSELHEQLST